jgi:hypothetical protein
LKEPKYQQYAAWLGSLIVAKVCFDWYFAQLVLSY